MQAKGRIYALDTLRATMMLLVVVIHAALTYNVSNFGSLWPIKDPRNTNKLFDFLVAFCHSSALPVFFVVSGFLAAMLFVENGPEKMIVNRLKRIGLPFVAGLVILGPIVFMAATYFNLTATGKANTFWALMEAFKAYPWDSGNTMHLWFLYFLCFFCIGGWGTALLCRKISTRITSKTNAGFEVIFRLRLAPALFAVITYLLFCVQRKGFIPSYIWFSIVTWIFLQFAVFFAFGWLLYHQKKHLDKFKKDDWLFAIIGTILFCVHYAIFRMQPDIEKTSGLYLFAAIKALSIWFSVFGIIGLFLRFFNTYSPVARYISDASYWIYLVHLPVVIFFQALLINFDINPIFKFLVVLPGTFMVVLIMYNFMVRNTFIGKFLNGRKYAPGLSNEGHAETGGLSA